MKLNFSFEKIYDQYKKGMFGRESAFQSLKWIIENDPNDDVRVSSIKILGRLKINGVEMYNFLEYLVLFDSNTYLRFVAVRLMLRYFPSQCSRPTT